MMSIYKYLRLLTLLHAYFHANQLVGLLHTIQSINSPPYVGGQIRGLRGETDTPSLSPLLRNYINTGLSK